VINVASVHMQEVYILLMVTAESPVLLILNRCETFPAAIEMVPKSKNGSGDERGPVAAFAMATRGCTSWRVFAAFS
jgi:hypothetical protein